jgi:hypothetical protein
MHSQFFSLLLHFMFYVSCFMFDANEGIFEQSIFDSGVS